MSFDAGEIIAYLKLNRTDFETGLEEARAEAKDPITIEVKPDLDQEAMDQVLAEEEPLRKDIHPQVKPEYAEGEAEALGQSLASDILTGMSEEGGIDAVLAAMLGQGVTMGELPPGLGLGFSAGEITQAIQAALASGVTQSGLTTGFEQAFVDADIGASLLDGMTLALESGAASEQAPAGFENVIDGVLGPVTRLTEQAFQQILLDIGNTSGFGAGGDILGQSFLNSVIEDMAGGTIGIPTITKALGDAGFTGEAIAAGIASAVDAGVVDASTGLTRDGVRVGTDFAAGFRQVLSGGSKLGGLFDFLSFGSGRIAAIFNPLGLTAGAAFVSAFGIALGGAVAGTEIGLAGVLAAVIPGLLDLIKGYEAYSAKKNGTSTKGFTPAQLGLGSALGGLLGPAGKGIGAAEKEVMPDVTRFITAITKAIPLMNEFAQPAIKAMQGFFNAIDKVMGGTGFKSFVGTMSKDVGPIMTDFGDTIRNIGGIWGGFLKLFGGNAARSVGKWFVKETGELDTFINHVKLSKGALTGFHNVFKSLGDVLHTVWIGLRKLWDGLQPVGEFLFRMLGPMAKFVGELIKMVPPWMITAVAGIAIGLKAMSIGIGLINIAMDVNPFVLIALGVAAVVIAIAELVKHWHTVWTTVKNVADGAWEYLDKFLHNDMVQGILAVVAPLILLGLHWTTVWGTIKSVAHTVWDFLDHQVLQPIADFFARVFHDAVTNAGKLWGSVWGGIETAVKTAWNIIKPILDAIANAIKTITGGIGSVVGDATSLVGKVTGGIVHDLNPSNWLAAGGPASAGTPYIVGEQGPELFVPSMSGTVIPNGAFGTSHQQIIFQIDARGATNPQAVASAAKSAVTASLPSLQAALARGAA